MKITEKTWVEYITRLSRLNETAGQKMADYIAKHGTGDTDALIAYAQALVQKYGEGTAELACQMYDALAEKAGANVPPAEPAEPADYGETARMVNATKQSPPLLQGGVSRLVKRAGADTTLKNAIRDGAEWAWVPHGDTCPFCITLASRGWQKASQKALKGDHAEHIHANCDCEYAIRFDSRTTVAGYDPEQYLKQYNAAGGDLNAMRRAQYAENKIQINAQKRAAYAVRKLQHASAGGILGENAGAYIPITEQSIDAVQPFECITLDKAGQNALAEEHRQLLRVASEQPPGVEVARCYGLNSAPFGDAVIGENGRVRIPDYNTPYIAAHTHPSGLTFSPGDILNFTKRDNMRMLSAVGNNGVVYAMEKSEDFNRIAVQNAYEKMRTRMEQEKTMPGILNVINDFFKEARAYGLQYYTRGN